MHKLCVQKLRGCNTKLRNVTLRLHICYVTCFQNLQQSLQMRHFVHSYICSATKSSEVLKESRSNLKHQNSQISEFFKATWAVFTLCPSGYFVLLFLAASLCSPQSATSNNLHPSWEFDPVPLCPACHCMPVGADCPGLWDHETALSPEPSGSATFPKSPQFELHFVFPSGAIYLVLLVLVLSLLTPSPPL